MFTNLKLKGKMLLGYALPIAVYLGLAGMVYSTANKVVNTFQEVQRVQDVLLNSSDLAIAAQGLIRSGRGYLVDANEKFITDYQESLKQAEEAGRNAEKLIKDAEQKDRLKQMLEQIRRYDTFTSDRIKLIQQGKKAEAIARFKSGQGTELVQEFDRLRQEFEKTQRDFLDERSKEATDALNFLILAVLAGSVAMIGLSITVALIISSSVAKTIHQATNAIASSSNQIAATVEQQERTSSQQAASVNETTTTMDELGASSRQSAEQAESVASGARQALTLAEGGTQAVNQSLQGMVTLKDKVAAISEQIMRLSEQTNQIGSITNLVSDLANQTNMLALNAAVEAARAGDHGKGFAVVAGEIRKLADQSKKSTERINTLIADIQSAINSTVMVTDEGTKTVDEGMRIAQNTAAAFGGVTDAVNNVFLSSQQISLNIKQQAIAVQQVVDAMNALNVAARETASGITQTRVGTQKLNEAAINLKAIV